MARPLRIEYPGAVYHITSRGNAKRSIYRGRADREAFLKTLKQVVDRFNWLCHAYCLMPNHYHLLIETVDPTLSRGMQQLNGVYTQTFNRKHARVGHVFQGRYKAILVEKEAYLLELSRYIVLNPVRAGLDRAAKGWKWSSYSATAGLVPVPSLLTTDWILSQFSSNKSEAQQRYRRFISQGRDYMVWEGLKGQIYLGSDAFIRSISHQHKNLSEVPRVQRLAARSSLDEIFRNYTENTGILMAYRENGYTMKAIAEHLGVHYATISRKLRNQEQVQHPTS
ncbi:MAG TPA: addiction module toxin RelE [Candidatus Acetothermia bacterium]|nr:addiction module toxin RelE [Candidatus Acetothermia bacterium]